jgi:hypothetical protein
MYDRASQAALAHARTAVEEPDDDREADPGRARTLSLALIERQFAPGGADTRARGEAGVAGSGAEVPHRAALEQAIGADFGGVRAHTGPEAQQACVALGAEAYALGDDIAFLDEQPAPEVVAHELAHTMQQGGAATVQPRAEGGPATEAEAQADAVADHVAHGAPGPARVHVHGGGERAVRRRAGMVHKFDAWAKKHNIKVELSETKRTASYESVSEEFGPSAEGIDGSNLMGDDVSDKRTRRAQFDWGTLSASAGSEYEINDYSPTKLREQIVDGKHVVERDQERLEREKKTIADQQRALEASLPGPEDPARADADRQRERLGKRLALVDAEIKANQATLKQIDGQLAKLDAGKVAEVAKEAPRTAREYSQRSLLKQATIWTVDTKSIGVQRSTAASERDAAGTTSTTTRSQKDSATLGEGVTGSRTTGHRHTLTDAEGQPIRERSREREVSGGAVMRDDGTIGVRGGTKLKDAIEDAHGNRAFVERAASGAYTVNIIPIPDRDPPAFAVVSTLSLGGDVGGGAGTERTGDRGKGSAQVTAGASAAVELTHTHVLDAGQARAYLADLEKAGEGQPTEGKRPEFALLQRAHAGIMDGDDAARAAQSLFGDPAAAAGMDAEESIEMTAKVGVRAGVSASAEGAGGGALGAEGGAAKEVYRTVKISRLPDAAGARLMEVTIAFGGSDTLHGALTASGLGVSAKVGGKQWSSADELVTFRLDADQADYQELYGEIVGCLTPSGLMALRDNPRYLAHVARYTRKQGQGGATSFEVGPTAGIGAFAAERSHHRTSEVTKEEDGGYVVTDTGGSTDTTRLTLGSVDVWRHDRAETVTSTHEGGRQFVEIGQQDTGTSVQWEIPGLKELITAESPAKAVKKAMEAKRKRLVEYHLDDATLDALVGRAYESQKWDDVGVRHYNPMLGRQGDLERWRTLRGQLVKPSVSAELAAWDPAAARSVARGAALCDFMDDSYNGFAFLQGAMREWNDGASVDLGVMYEWPPSLLVYKPLIEDTRKQVALIDIKLDAFTSDPETGPERGANLVTNLQEKLDLFEPKLKAADDFKNPRAKIEILADLDRMRNRLVEERREFFLSFGGGVRDVAADAKHDETRLRSRREQLHDLCHQARKEEVLLLGQARRTTPAKQQGHWNSLVAGFGGSGTWQERLSNVLHQLRELHEAWIVHVKELRQVYLTLGTPPNNRYVSLDRRDERRSGEPDAAAMREYYDLLARSELGAMSTWGNTGSVKMMSNEDRMKLYDY